jgi:hypothetical protein
MRLPEFFLSILFFCLTISAVFAQADSLKVTIATDSLSLLLQPKHSPDKAALYSAVLPGLGQIYNGRWWKVPLLYGGGSVLGYFIYFNNRRHRKFQDSFRAKLYGLPNDKDPYPTITLESARLNKNYFKRNRDFLIIISVLVYGLNIVDATVDAHLKSFDVSDKLSLSVQPQFEQIGQQSLTGVSLRLNLK